MTSLLTYRLKFFCYNFLQAEVVIETLIYATLNLPSLQLYILLNCITLLLNQHRTYHYCLECTEMAAHIIMYSVPTYVHVMTLKCAQ